LFSKRTANRPKNCAPSAHRPARRVHLGVESLEARLVPTVNYYGGALLQNVEVQAVYYGSDWSTNPAYLQDANYLESYLDSLVHSSYLRMLRNVGYGVGPGSSGPVRLMNHVQSAVAGQGVSYVLLSDGTLLEYVESTDTPSGDWIPLGRI
jgi:hypothetical protein